jgi:hypothetical protein
MPRGNPQNLKSNRERTEENVREITRKGGIASGKARRDKKNLRLALETLLEKRAVDPDTGRKMTGAELITLKLYEQAVQGNVKAFEVLRDSIGQKPIEKVMLAEVDQTVIDEVESAVYDDGEEGNGNDAG